MELTNQWKGRMEAGWVLFSFSCFTGVGIGAGSVGTGTVYTFLLSR